MPMERLYRSEELLLLLEELAALEVAVLCGNAGCVLGGAENIHETKSPKIYSGILEPYSIARDAAVVYWEVVG
uniref:Oxidored_FMN domain-containing protein n=1 Tax=Ascaris lumbricoides TaxID=6252 RepID=A0A0M3IL35_ASCLU